MSTSAVLQRADKAVGVAKRAYDLMAPGLGFVLGLTVPTKSIDPRTVYSLGEVAKLLKVRDVAAVQALVDTGQLPAREVGGQHVVLGQAILDFFK
ncbi:MAG: helix-turn-helix domain-containing protein [Armatimonadetes bacterium]|nr:helix-turn-helix domain-containing protein [Armatimonadota bacterium]NCO90635.1 helix-turn-helix domain-containing protein [Armatimonadota bacterium]NCP32570.1 helix-turn-helix domain-containing protein [Armatimonadota bacterium]NCQ29378.1 helix-turn-helix domain-containing protein [Armatimonadota bacterium]NDK12353.1 helix-turn-helix domain-containing protein [Armatimonadota bacterium]